ncbi:hypothetical protein Rhopal_003637-T1 [Rhodotorula paludigena]|uniref:LIM zinc-binding domain-containing protein n=1 Tax=Rhodotorula paludigena TaxID=86838 RepID=A0AAV5GL92_9BASI|nr:hypothetical protein Rhopal_003637-T1 [Rhodotorula paludigena]
MHSREGTYVPQSLIQLEDSAQAGSSRAYSAGGTWDDDPQEWGATLPTPTHAATIPTTHTPTPAALPADPTLAAFHRSLVAYYWNFAQQGFVAPLTAPEGSAERVRQHVARKEAVDWALTCGIAVVDPSMAALAQGAYDWQRRPPTAIAYPTSITSDEYSNFTISASADARFIRSPLASGMRGMSLVDRGEAASPVGAVPSIVLPEGDEGQEVTVSPSVKPTVPTFSFDDGGADEPEAVVPTFSFGGSDDENDSPSTTHVPLPEAGTLTCTSCRALIFGRVLVALGREWHPDCFRCAEEGCGARLEVMEFEGTPEDWEGLEEGEGEREEDLQGKAWCMVHFEERFALECHHCRTPIASADYLPIHDPLLPPRADYRHPSTRYYHPLHFFCAGCGDPFVDPTSYELLPASSADGLEATPYVAREGHPYCDVCDLRMWREKCPGCGKGLREEDGFLEVEGAKWHEGCFRCSMCAKPLTGFYLLRRDAPSSPSSPPQAPSQKEDADEYADERPYCADCYDVKAKEEAEQAVASRAR